MSNKNLFFPLKVEHNVLFNLICSFKNLLFLKLKIKIDLKYCASKLALVMDPFHFQDCFYFENDKEKKKNETIVFLNYRFLKNIGF